MQKHKIKVGKNYVKKFWTLGGKRHFEAWRTIKCLRQNTKGTEYSKYIDFHLNIEIIKDAVDSLKWKGYWSWKNLCWVIKIWNRQIIWDYKRFFWKPFKWKGCTRQLERRLYFHNTEKRRKEDCKNYRGITVSRLYGKVINGTKPSKLLTSLIFLRHLDYRFYKITPFVKQIRSV